MQTVCSLNDDLTKTNLCKAAVTCFDNSSMSFPWYVRHIVLSRALRVSIDSCISFSDWITTCTWSMTLTLVKNRRHRNTAAVHILVFKQVFLHYRFKKYTFTEKNFCHLMLTWHFFNSEAATAGSISSPDDPLSTSRSTWSSSKRDLNFSSVSDRAERSVP